MVDIKIAATSLAKSLEALDQYSNAYRNQKFRRKIQAQEIDQARAILTEINRAAAEVQGRWSELAQSQEVTTVVSETVSSRFRPDRVTRTLRNLVEISATGLDVMRHLDPLVDFADHYFRQCRYLHDESSNTNIREEDASELRASIGQLVKQVRDEVNLAQSQIHLLTLFSQTDLTARMRLLTMLLVLLTVGIIVVSIVAAVFSALAAVG